MESITFDGETLFYIKWGIGAFLYWVLVRLKVKNKPLIPICIIFGISVALRGVTYGEFDLGLISLHNALIVLYLIIFFTLLYYGVVGSREARKLSTLSLVLLGLLFVWLVFGGLLFFKFINIYDIFSWVGELFTKTEGGTGKL